MEMKRPLWAMIDEKRQDRAVISRLPLGCPVLFAAIILRLLGFVCGNHCPRRRIASCPLALPTSCLSCLSSLSRLVSFRMRSSITITEKANTLLTVTTRIVRLIISGTLGYFGTNHFSNPNTSKTAQQKVQCLSNFSHIKSQVESTSSPIRSTIIEMSLTQVFTGS